MPTSSACAARCSRSWASTSRPSTASSTRQPSRRCSRKTSRSRARSPVRSTRRGRTLVGRARRLSSELWETINAAHAELGGRMRTSVGPGRHDFFGWVRDRAAAFHGVVDSTMSRDDGYRFLVLGRSLERADMTARMLSAGYGDVFGQVGWTTTLRACSAHEAYLRTYRRAVIAPSVVEFLLLDRLFPRSVYHVLTTAEHCLGELNPTAARGGRRRRRVANARTHARRTRIPPHRGGDQGPAEAARPAPDRMGIGELRHRTSVLPRDPRHRMERVTCRGA